MPDKAHRLRARPGVSGTFKRIWVRMARASFPKWTSHRENLDTEEFQQEFEEVLEALVGDEQYGGFLKSRDAMRDFCREHQESGYDSGFAFGFPGGHGAVCLPDPAAPLQGGGKPVYLLLSP